MPPPLSFLRFKATPPDTRLPPENVVQMFYDREQGMLVAIDHDGERIAFDADGEGGSAAWGDITGTLSAQTDLQSALNAKLANITGLVTAGTNITVTGSGTSVSPFVISAPGGAGATWGTITGTLSSQTDLQSALNLKAPLNNAALTGATTAVGLTATTLSATDFTATSGNSVISTNGGAINIASTGVNPVVISSTVTGIEMTGTLYLDLGSDATGDTFYRDSNGAVARRAIGTNTQILTVSGGLPTWVDRTSITTIGTVTTGTWNATVVAPTYGGTGMNNGGLVADRYLYTSGTGTFTSGTITTAGRALLDDASASAQRTTLGLGTAAVLNGSFGGNGSDDDTKAVQFGSNGEVIASQILRAVDSTPPSGNWSIEFFATGGTQVIEFTQAAFVGDITAPTMTASRTWELPDKSGVVAIVPSYVDNAGAISGGLAAGDSYYNTTVGRVRAVT